MMNSTSNTSIADIRPSVIKFAEDNDIPYIRLQVNYTYNEAESRWEKDAFCPNIREESSGKASLPSDYRRGNLMTNEKIRNNFNNENKDANAIALMLGASPFVLVDTDSKEATAKIKSILKERNLRCGSTQTKKGHHFYFKITGSKSKISFGANKDTKIDILGNKKSFSYELIDRNFSSPESFCEIEVDDFIAYFQSVAKTKPKQSKKTQIKKTIIEEATEAPVKHKFTIKEKSYASGLWTIFDPKLFDNYHDWRMLANWCVVHGNFQQFHDISQKAPKYKDERDCKRAWDNEVANKWRISVGWGVNKAKESNEKKWLQYKKKHMIQSVKGFTDYELARRLQENFCDKFIAVGKELYYYDGTKWINEGEGHFRRVVAEDLYANIQSFIDHEDEITQEHLADIYASMDKLRSTSKQNAVLTQFMSMVQEQPDIFIQENEHLFPFLNGVYNALEDKLCDHDSNYFNRVCFPFDYEPEIMLEEEATHEINDMWQKIFHEEEDLEFVKTAICRHLMGKQTKHILWLHGSKGNNGKSALLNTLMTALEDYGASINTSLLQSKFDSGKPQPELNNLMGKKIIFGSEVDTTAPFNTQTIKTFTGGDPITGRMLYSNTPFKFVCKALFIVACNQFPSFTDNDKALHESRNRTIPIDTEFLPKEKYVEAVANCPEEERATVLAHTHLGDEKFVSPQYHKEVRPHMIHILMSWLSQGYHNKELKQPINSKNHMKEALCDTEEIQLLIDYTDEASWDNVITARDLYKHAVMLGAKPILSEQKFCKAIAKNTYLDGKYVAKLGKRRGVIKGYTLKKNLNDTFEADDDDGDEVADI